MQTLDVIDLGTGNDDSSKQFTCRHFTAYDLMIAFCRTGHNLNCWILWGTVTKFYSSIAFEIDIWQWRDAV